MNKELKFKLNYNQLDCVLGYVERLLRRERYDFDDLLEFIVLGRFCRVLREKYVVRFDGYKRIGVSLEVGVCLLKHHFVGGYTGYELGVIEPMVSEFDRLFKNIKL